MTRSYANAIGARMNEERPPTGRDRVRADARKLERAAGHAEADLVRELLEELKINTAALDLLKRRFAELAAERDELVLRCRRPR